VNGTPAPFAGTGPGSRDPEVGTARPIEPAWQREAAVVARQLGTDLELGLTAAEAAARLERCGPNELTERTRVSPLRVLVRQFTSAMILVLAVAAGITLALGDLKGTIVILAIVALNGMIGFTKEHRAERAMDALRRIAAPAASVVRDGVVTPVPGPELVPGDVVRLEPGDVVTADVRLATVRALRINEAALTGESIPAEKTAEPLPTSPPRSSPTSAISRSGARRSPSGTSRSVPAGWLSAWPSSASSRPWRRWAPWASSAPTRPAS
jgi:Ca2+-transporting ATPase